MINAIRIVKPGTLATVKKIERLKDALFEVLEDCWVIGHKIDPWDPRLSAIRAEVLNLMDEAIDLDNDCTLALIHF